MVKNQFKHLVRQRFLLGLTLIAYLLFLKVDLNSMVYGRIKGEVFADDSEIPIINATVKLIHYFPDSKRFSIKTSISTDKSGKFDFNDIIPGYYLVKVEKDGYIPTIPDYKFNALYGIELENLKKAFQVVTINNEGSIKYLKIALKSGHTIKGKISGITKTEYFGRLAIKIILSRKTDESEKVFHKEGEFEIVKPFVNSDGLYCFAGLEPRNDYKLIFETEGFPRQYYNNIDIITKDTAIIDCIYNDSDKTGLKGKVKIFGKIPRSFTIILSLNLGGDENPYYWHKYRNIPNSNFEGEFSISMVSPGKYYIHVYAFDENHQGYEKVNLIEIKKDESMTIDFNF